HPNVTIPLLPNFGGVIKDTIVVQRYGLSAMELNEFLSSYPIPSEYDVIFPTSTQTIFDTPPGYVGL
ncbi:hypothetical protein Tco_0225284, partial [Tanacetum coccineum]